MRLTALNVAVTVVFAVAIRRMVVVAIPIPAVIIASVPATVLCNVAPVMPAVVPGMFVVLACVTNFTFVTIVWSAVSLMAFIGLDDCLGD